MNQITPVMPEPNHALSVDHIKASLPAFQGQYIKTKEELEKTQKAVATLSPYADLEWLGGRIATLLSHYYVAELSPAVQEKIASDWIRELKDFPAWAIDAAAAWWLSRHNPKATKKPIPGEISKQAHDATACLRIAKGQIARYEKYGDNPPDFLR